MNKLVIRYKSGESLHTDHQEDLEIHEQIGLMLKHNDVQWDVDPDIFFFEFTPIFEPKVR